MVMVMRSPSESGEHSRVQIGQRVLLTDRTDAISYRLIGQTMPIDRVVCVGQPHDDVPRRLGKDGGETTWQTIEPKCDIDTVFVALFPLFPVPPGASSKAKPIGKKLSPRETEVLRQLAEGASIREIAAELDLATRTVENQKYRMMEKLQIKNLSELTRYAIRIRLIEP